jgi:hypothetical protein
MNTLRTAAGLAVAPLVPGVALAAALMLANEREFALALLGASIFFGYPIALLLGLPIHLVLLRARLTAWYAYLLAGALLGIFLFVSFPLLLQFLMMLDGVGGGYVTFSPDALPAMIVCAVVGAMVFWYIVRPDRDA